MSRAGAGEAGGAGRWPPAGPGPPGRPDGEGGIGLVEVLIALVILSVGLLSIAGISMSVGAQTRWATWQTDQALAAQVVLERVHDTDFDGVAAGTDTVWIGSREYIVNRTVTLIEPRVKEVRATVSARVDVAPRSFVTRVHDARQLPSAPE